ncbi:Alpha/beta hydrolase fold [Parasponia andersonii]|uniref:Alpha/beta hydrolase fold n=1 Tax=Parasponia andersonii TaxID=3476 RepID=A0A2P5D956_PARAD|nr:Alpha/beta hydrolase fold [Parasponia andersonii]
MAEVRGPNAWRDELASLIEDTGVRYVADPITISTTPSSFDGETTTTIDYQNDKLEEAPPESLKDQVKGFAMAWVEILMELGRGCRDIVQQSLLTEDSYIVRKLEKPIARASAKLRYFNEFLPEDRDPAHAWPVVFFVFILALAAINVNTQYGSLVPRVKRARIHPPNATRIQLPDGRHMAYHEQGVTADRARFSIIIPHSFLSSRLAGLPGIKMSLLEEFGIRLVTYDLPGFGESDPHPSRNLNTSALDMLHLANAVGVSDKFWVLAHSGGGMHAWAALKYIPNKVAGAALFAPMMNPYEPGMTKEEMKRTWENWLPRRKFLYFLAHRFPRFLSSFYHRTFLSGKLGQIDKWLSDEILIEEPIFEELWDRNLEESIRQRNVKPFIEEAMLQVSNWGFRLSELQVQRRCQGRGILPWLRSMYSQAECELTGYLGPIHIWQGMDDHVVPPSMTDYIARVLPEANVHKLPNEGIYFPRSLDPLKVQSSIKRKIKQPPSEENEEEKS